MNEQNLLNIYLYIDIYFLRRMLSKSISNSSCRHANRSGWKLWQANIQVVVGGLKPALICQQACFIILKRSWAIVISLVRECEPALRFSIRGILWSHPVQEQLVEISIRTGSRICSCLKKIERLRGFKEQRFCKITLWLVDRLKPVLYFFFTAPPNLLYVSCWYFSFLNWFC